MSDQQVTVVARFSAKPDKIEELKQELLALVPQTRAEEGCINYDLHQDPDSPTEFVFYENFVTAEALKSHAAQPYIVRINQIAGDLCVESPNVTTWQMISEKS